MRAFGMSVSGGGTRAGRAGRPFALIAGVVMVAGSVWGCGGTVAATPATAGTSATAGTPATAGKSATAATAAAAAGRTWMDATQPLDRRVSELLAQMTLDEKIGQMTQIENGSIDPAGSAQLMLGSVLSGGDGNPSGANDATGWYQMVGAYEKAAAGTRLGIPLLYGIDAVHGNGHMTGTTVFPHNVGLGATHDPALVEKSCRITAQETAAVGVRWDFAPELAVPQDVRWGR